MKKILILMSFVLPVFLTAQTRPAPKKVAKTKSTDFKKPVKPISFTYVIMDVTEVKSKKEPTVLKYNFDTMDEDLSKSMYTAIKNRTSVLEVINTLGRRGFELISVQNGRYYFKIRSEFVRRR